MSHCYADHMKWGHTSNFPLDCLLCHVEAHVLYDHLHHLVDIHVFIVYVTTNIPTKSSTGVNKLIQLHLGLFVYGIVLTTPTRNKGH